MQSRAFYFLITIKDRKTKDTERYIKKIIINESEFSQKPCADYICNELRFSFDCILHSLKFKESEQIVEKVSILYSIN